MTTEEPLGPAGDPLAGAVSGPPVAVIAWIPFYRKLADGPGKAWRDHRLAGALGHLFRTGNDSPPATLYGEEVELDAIVANKDFRAVIALTQVTINCRSGSMPTLQFQELSRIGYTRFRLRRFVHFSSGRGRLDREVLSTTTSATISYRLAFKLGRLTNLAQRVMTGRWAPSAWVEIDYTLRCNGEATVVFRGTEIPSRNHYVDWRRVSGHDMTDLGVAEIDGFMNAGDCIDAPEGSSSSLEA